MTDKRSMNSGSSIATSSIRAAGKENVPKNTADALSGNTSTKTPRKARKALHATWSTPGNIQVPGIGCDSIHFLPETPVRLLHRRYFERTKYLIALWNQSKSLIGDSSVLFSPPSIIRETLPESQEGEEAFGHPPNRSNTSLESSGSRSPMEKAWFLSSIYISELHVSFS